MTRACLTLACVALVAACKGPVGPVVQVTVAADNDPAVLSEIHGLRVVARAGGDSETVEFPEGGPGAAPIELEADFALVASDVSGTMTIEVTALARVAGGDPVSVGFGMTELVLSEEVLYRAEVQVGVRSLCGQGDTPPSGAPLTDVPKICFRRDDMELVLGGGDPIKGNINNGVELSDLDGDGTVDVLAAWSEDRDEPAHISGASVFYGAEVADRGVIYTQQLEADFVDKGDAGERRSNTEAIAVPLIGETGGASDFAPDLVTASLGVKGLTIRPRRGGRFYEDPIFLPLDKEPGEMQAADLLEASEGLELVVALRKEAALLIVTPAIDDTGPQIAQVEGLEAAAGVRGLHVADLDGAHGLDIVSAAKGESEANEKGQLTVHLSNGAGGFTAAPASAPDFGWHDVRAGDLDGDGDADLAAVNVDRGVVGIFKGTGDGTFLPGLEYTLTGGDGVQQRPDRVRLGDFDGDGRTDVLACAVGQSALHLLILGADGEPRFPVIRLPGGEGPGEAGEDLQGCAIADTTKDGTIDRLAVTDRLKNRVRVFVNDR